MRFIIYSLVLLPIVCFASSPDSFFGTYQSDIGDCQVTFLIVDKDKVSFDGCKKLPYKTSEVAEHHIVIDVMPSKACARKIIKIERKEQQYKTEGKDPRSDVPTFVSFVVTIYENYDDTKTNKPMETRNYMRVDPSKAYDQKAVFLTGKTGLQRKEALHEINLQCYEERDKYNEIGLNDPSPDVRAIAAGFLSGMPYHFVPMLINTIANDPNAKVRASAGYSLSHFYTDNGAEGYLYIKPLENNLDKLLMGLRNVETVRPVVEILGSRDGLVAPCYMSVKNKKKIVTALKKQRRTIQEAYERRDQNVPWNMEWGFADTEISLAIENINKCRLSKR
jgi:hypothetical protein